MVTRLSILDLSQVTILFLHFEEIKCNIFCHKNNKLYSIFVFVCIVAFVWNTLCRSCDIAGTQGEVGKGKISLSECKKLCEQEINCVGIDFGKGSRLQECYLNLGIYEMHVAHDDFDVYILSRQDLKEEKHPLRSKIYKYVSYMIVLLIILQ